MDAAKGLPSGFTQGSRIDRFFLVFRRVTALANRIGLIIMLPLMGVMVTTAVFMRYVVHRPIVGADEIIVLDQGRIAERGTHVELLAADGLYASMWNRQREAQEAREKLALIGDADDAPNRGPPPVDDPLVAPAAAAE